MNVRLALASDHAAYELKQHLAGWLRDRGHAVTDLGTDSTAPVDYPDFARRIGLEVTSGRVERGILMCGSGVGASVAANKMPGVRAAVCHDSYSAHQGVEHDAMNILVIGSRVIGPMLAEELVERFLGARFSGEERHLRRLHKVEEMDARRGE